MDYNREDELIMCICTLEKENISLKRELKDAEREIRELHRELEGYGI